MIKVGNFISKTQTFNREDIKKILRISLIDYCNFQCFFCHNEGQFDNKNKQLPLDEVVNLSKVAYKLGIRQIKLTGGEPLLYPDIVHLVEMLSKISNNNDLEISMVTNGYFLEKFADELKKAGLARVNISLVSLNPNLMRKYIYKNADENTIKRIERGIKKAVKVGLRPVKINFILFFDKKSGENNIYELPLIFKKSKEWGVDEIRIYTLVWHPKFKNFENFYIYYDNPFFLKKLKEGIVNVLKLPEKIFERIVKPELLSFINETPKLLYPRTRKIFIISNLKITFEPMKMGRFSNIKVCEKCPFRSRCQEGPYSLRLHADGEIRGCLLRKNHINIIEKQDDKVYFSAIKKAFELLP